ncbi:hypothetical protein JXA32_03075 [Candidatus Sumerlaeota bacterium]|nr:hypothetical protein [Candidatus Sumerlaeota bacterium]
MSAKALKLNRLTILVMMIAAIFALATSGYSQAPEIMRDAQGHVYMDSAPVDGSGYRSPLTNNIHSLESAQRNFTSNAIVALNELDPQEVDNFRAAGKTDNDAGMRRVSLMNRVDSQVIVTLKGASAGVWEDLPDGSRVWHIKVYSPDAIGMRPYFSVFELSEGIEVNVYNFSDPDEAYGPYTNRGPLNKGLLIAHPVMSDTIVLECHVPAELLQPGQTPRINLAFDGCLQYFETPKYLSRNTTKRALPEKEPRECYLDPTCYTAYASQQAGVMMLETPVFSGADCSISGGGLCTGNLLNNTGQRYFILTAYHCIGADCADYAEVGLLMVYNYETMYCDVPPIVFGDSPISEQFPNTLGATTLAYSPTNGGNDMFLLEGDGEPPAGATMLGWTTNVPDSADFVVNISHPYGDYKALMLGYVNVVQQYNPDMYTEVTPTKGTPEPGSSGSALFGENLRLVGQLLGGSVGPSGCEGGLTYWGRFDVTYPLISQYMNNNDEDQYENNDTYTQSASVPEGCLTGKANDDDWYVFSAPASGITGVTLSFNGNLASDTGIDLDLYLYINTGGTTLTLVGSSTNGSPTGYEEAAWANTGASPVNLYVEVRYVDGPRAQSYELCIDTETTDTDDRFEENDISGDAAQLTSGQFNDLVLRDSDWYIVTVPNGVELNVTATFPDGDYNPSLDLRIIVLLGTNLAFYAEQEPLRRTVSWANTTGGPVAVLIEANSTVINPDSPLNYALTISFLPLDDAYEDNDTLSTAYSPMELGWYQGLVMRDDDYYAVTVDAGMQLIVNINFSNATSNINMDLYDAYGTLLVQSFGTSDYESVSYLNTTGAPITVIIRVFNFYSTDPSNAYNMFITYLEDGYEENDTQVTAAPIGLGNYTSLVLRDDDYYRVPVDPGMQLVVNLEFNSSLSDIDLELYSASGVLLGSSFNQGDYESLSWTNTTAAAVNILIHVFNFTPSASSNVYTMTVSELPVAASAARDIWLFASGSTDNDHMSYLTLLNESAKSAAEVLVMVYFEDYEPLPLTYEIPANSRYTINFAKEFINIDRGFTQHRGMGGKHNFGVYLMSLNKVDVTIEEAVYWTEANIYRCDGYAAAGVNCASRDWFLAEGSTGADRKTQIELLNPYPADVQVMLTLLVEEGTNLTETITIPAQRRMTINAGDYLPESDFSIRAQTITAGHPGVIVERTMYGGTTNYPKIWGHHAMGSPEASSEWYLAEGATHKNFETFILAANPNSVDTTIQYEFFASNSDPVTITRVVPAYSRKTVKVNDVAGMANNSGFATKITSLDGSEFYVERSVYWKLDGITYRTGGTDSTGISSLSTNWWFAEGAIGGGSGFESFITLANPSATTATVKATFVLSENEEYAKELDIAPGRRATVIADTVVPAGSDTTSMAAKIVSLNGVPILAERAMYWSGGATSFPGVSTVSLTESRIGGHAVGGVKID